MIDLDELEKLYTAATPKFFMEVIDELRQKRAIVQRVETFVCITESELSRQNIIVKLHGAREIKGVRIALKGLKIALGLPS